MKTVCIQIGNSDDKLSQKEWSRFVDEVRDAVIEEATEVYFFACSDGGARWQNACWVVRMDDVHISIPALKEKLFRIRLQYRQESVAWMEGDTIFF